MGTALGVFVAFTIVFVLVSAVVFHVLLAQGQLELDHLDERIAAERHEYEHRRLETATLSSPPRIYDAAVQLGLVTPAESPTYLEVVGARALETGPSDPSTTLDDWRDVKPNLGDNQP